MKKSFFTVSFVIFSIFLLFGCKSDSSSDPVPPQNPAIGKNWIQATAAADFSVRQLPHTVVLDNKMFILCGQASDYNVKDDVWSSTDGISWTQIIASVGFTGDGVGYDVVVYNNKIWVLETLPDIYNIWSSSDGVSWSKTATNAFPDGRAGILAHDNKMWVFVRLSSNNNISIYNSTDGISWTQIASDIGVPARWPTFTGLVSYDNKMWIIGGWDEDSDTTVSDVWSSADGVTWSKVTDAAGFEPRFGMSTVVYDSKMWVIGGMDSDDKVYNDSWYSSDGITWTQATSNPDFTARGFHSIAVYDEKMWIIGGYDGTNDLNDVWYSP